MSPKAEEGRGRRAGHAREDILLAAARAFGRIGVPQATMSEIAQEAGYTVPSLYAYYSGKDEIVESLGMMLSGEILTIFNEGFPAGLTSGQRVELLLRRLFAMTERRREILAVFFTLPMSGSPKGLGDGFEVLRQRLSRWFRENEELGPGSRRTADDLSVALLGLCDAFVRRWLHEERRTLLVHQASHISALFLHGAQPWLKS
jgi:AcrR family transcriptional regulator